MKFRISCAMSLDGFLFFDTDRGDGYKAFLASVTTIVMGRKTYEVTRRAKAWEFAGKRSIVLTSQALGDLPPEVDTTPGPVAMLAADLRKHATGDVWIMGGAQVMGAFLDAGAVDSMALSIMPVLLGRGIRLFTRTGPPLTMDLLETQKFKNGVVRVLYEKPKANGSGAFG